MIVRTYGRRNRGISRTYSDSADDAVPDPFRDSLSSQETPPEDFYSFPFSTQESSSLWPSSLDPSSSQDNSVSILPRKSRPEDDSSRRSKKQRNGKSSRRFSSSSASSGSLIPLTSTLMEAQEFGEMMEHVDEVNFALDGLKKGQQVRIRRASLLSLLSICSTGQQRRLLRAQGIAKTIIDAILGLSFDDVLSNLAAATLFFVLTGDGQDEHILESPSCIWFLIKLLKPVVSTTTEDKTRKIGCKLLSLRKSADIARDTTKMPDSSSAAILSKVQEILVSCKEIKLLSADDSEKKRPELSQKWIALLTMEKACLSKISFEDTSGTVRKTGGSFKEKLRELGGLDAVFEVAMTCHSVMESWTVHSSPSGKDRKADMDKQTLMLLLKFLKIMENATFLSKDNQIHLLGMKGNTDSHGSRLSFTELMISVIKILSSLHLLSSSSAVTIVEKSASYSDGIGHAAELALIEDFKVASHEVVSINSSKCSSIGKKNFDVSQNSQSTAWLDFSVSGSESATKSINGPSSQRIRLGSSTSGSFGEKLGSSNGGPPTGSDGSLTNSGLFGRPEGRRHDKCPIFEDNQDPYAFDEDDFEPSKWDLLSGKQKSRIRYSQPEDGLQYQLMISQQESNSGLNSQKESSNGEYHHSHELSSSHATDEECSSLLADCLHTAVKVLMNLTNDNPIGCQQIAACGGLETMTLLIATHFPSFSSPLSLFNEIKENSLGTEPDLRNDRHLSDQELDFLVAILGLLVNLVEKDGRNRSRLAAASVPLPNSEGLEEEIHRDVISLLCSVFLANRGAGDPSGEGRDLSWNDEEAVLQGEKEAEKMIVEAYAALLLAFLSTESKSIRNAIADCLPNHNLAILVPVLERFVAFHLTLNMISPETHKAVSEIIESCRVP